MPFWELLHCRGIAIAFDVDIRSLAPPCLPLEPSNSTPTAGHRHYSLSSLARHLSVKKNRKKKNRNLLHLKSYQTRPNKTRQCRPAHPFPFYPARQRKKPLKKRPNTTTEIHPNYIALLLQHSKRRRRGGTAAEASIATPPHQVGPAYGPHLKRGRLELQTPFHSPPRPDAATATRRPRDGSLTVPQP
jgi:hypothetical protein